METNLWGGLDAQICRNIDYHAARLARDRAVPGMDRDDYRQDLLADLLSRRKAYDPRLAGIRTFADRVVRHRVSGLRSHTLRKDSERATTSLDEAGSPGPAEPAALLDTLIDPDAPDPGLLGLRVDLKRFICNLPPQLVECCGILLSDSIASGARESGVARSTVYERMAQLRHCAEEAGLRIYVLEQPDSLRPTPVSSSQASSPAGAPRMTADFSQSRRVASCFEEWLEVAEAGSSFEYHRGYLAMDLGSDRSGNLEYLARRVRSASDLGLVHLLQRRLGTGVYCYLAVARPRQIKSGVKSAAMAGGAS